MQNLTRNPHAKTSHRAGFTLIELMITIVIIGILMALIIPAISAVRTRVQVSKVKAEIEALERAISDFKGTYQVDVPSYIILYEDPAGWSTNDPDTKRSITFIRRLWRQFDYSIARDINGDGDADDVLELTGAECLVFFLGGVRDGNDSFAGFSKNPSDPFSLGSANREGPFYTEFLNARLVDLDGDGMYEYLDSLPGQTAPFVYISSNDGRGYQVRDLVTGSSNDLENYYRTGSDTGAAWQPKSYQIISPGIDQEFGDGGKYDPETASNDLTGTRKVERDNITSFNSGLRMAD